MITTALSAVLALRCLAHPDEPASLQEAMEAFADNFENPEAFQNQYGEYLDITKWDGLRVVAGNVKRIRWNRRGFRGLFHFAALPHSVETIVISQNEFTGEIAHLPDALQFFSCEENKFHGTIDWAALPSGITFFDARQNKLTGEMDLRVVPHSLENIYIRKNAVKITNSDAPGAWRGGGDVYSQFSSSKKAKTPGARKAARPEARPVSESVPYLAQAKREVTAEDTADTATQCGVKGVAPLVFPSAPFEDSLLDESEVLEDQTASSDSETDGVTGETSAPEPTKRQTSWLARILQLLVFSLGVTACVVFFNVNNFI